MNVPNVTASNSDSTATKPGSKTKSFDDKTRKKVMTVKTTIKNIWKPECLQPLYNLVNTTHTVVTHTFAFSKYMFLKELSANSNFNLNEFVRKEFSVEVFLSLIAQNTTRRAVKHKDTTAE
ncbi:hypothetical protein BD408DRAFT_445393 [Parasitella parasitica]|nr:hypothetical protein BD408DRAFT_445393 [Parasitella parasitica]